MSTTIPTDSITDTSRGVHKVIGFAANPTASAEWSVAVSGDLPTFTGWNGQRFVPALVVWRHGYHHGEDCGVEVDLYTATISTGRHFTADDAPDWVPRPPAGWDAGVAAVIASLP